MADVSRKNVLVFGFLLFDQQMFVTKIKKNDLWRGLICRIVKKQQFEVSQAMVGQEPQIPPFSAVLMLRLSGFTSTLLSKKTKPSTGRLTHGSSIHPFSTAYLGMGRRGSSQNSISQVTSSSSSRGIQRHSQASRETVSPGSFPGASYRRDVP